MKLKPLLTILSTLILLHVSAKKIVVGSNGPIISLRQAVSIATDGDTIVLSAGIYKEGNVIITKSITVIGDNNPVLDGQNKYEILTISGKNISIRGITFRNSGCSAMNDFASIKVINATN